MFFFCVFPGLAQEKVAATPALQGQGLFIENCSTCHKNANEGPKAASQQTLMQMTPEAVLSTFMTGPMAVQAKNLSDQEKRLIAIYLGGRPLGSAEAGDAKTMPNHCASSPDLGDPLAGAAWNGWCVDIANTRFRPAKAAGLSASDVPQLKLKWAFGFPNGVHAYGQPTVAGGRVFVGSDTSFVYSLDARSGCIYWSYLAQTGVRTAISIGHVKGRSSAEYAVYFGDDRANVYAVNAAAGGADLESSG